MSASRPVHGARAPSRRPPRRLPGPALRGCHGVPSGTGFQCHHSGATGNGRWSDPGCGEDGPFQGGPTAFPTRRVSPGGGDAGRNVGPGRAPPGARPRGSGVRGGARGPLPPDRPGPGLSPLLPVLPPRSRAAGSCTRCWTGWPSSAGGPGRPGRTAFTCPTATAAGSTTPNRCAPPRAPPRTQEGTLRGRGVQQEGPPQALLLGAESLAHTRGAALLRAGASVWTPRALRGRGRGCTRQRLLAGRTCPGPGAEDRGRAGPRRGPRGRRQLRQARRPHTRAPRLWTPRGNREGVGGAPHGARRAAALDLASVSAVRGVPGRTGGAVLVRVPLEREEDPGVRGGPRGPQLPSVFPLSARSAAGPSRGPSGRDPRLYTRGAPRGRGYTGVRSLIYCP